MKRFFGFCMVGAVALTLNACSGTKLEQAEAVEPQGSQFDVALADGYKSLSSNEYNEGDYTDSDTFADRSIAAGTGNSPAPEEIGARAIPADKVGELSDARTRLVTALNNGGGSVAPADAAEAQVMFDCWMQEQEENWPFQQDQISECRDNYYAAIGRVEAALAPGAPPPPAPSDSLVFFDWDSSELTPEARSIVNQAAANAKAQNATRIVAVGHTDTSGSARYNEILSVRRAEAVRDEMVLSGVPADIIEVIGRGQTEPLIATPDGVREPQNRRVAIQIVSSAGAKNETIDFALVK